MLKNVTDGQLLAPDDWSLVQETLPPHHPVPNFSLNITITYQDHGWWVIRVIIGRP